MKDYAQDTDHVILHSLNAEIAIPTMVKEASVVSAEDVAKMSSNMFADTQNKTFPISSHADTWLSAAYFQKQAGQDANVEARLRDACSMWDIDFDSTRTMAKEASAPASMGDVNYINDQGDIVHTAKPNNAEDMHKLANDLIDSPLKYSYSMRKSASLDILKHTAEAKLTNNLVCKLQKCAGLGVGSLEGLNKAVALRHVSMPKLGFDDHRERLDKLASSARVISKEGMLRPEFCEMASKVLSVIDSNIDTDRLGNKYAAPEQDIFGISAHSYQMYRGGMLKLANGNYIAKRALNYRDMADYLSVAFGKEATTNDEIESGLVDLNGKEADLVSAYLEKRSEENSSLPEEALSHSKEDLEDGEKSELPSETPLDWATDEEAPREEDNQD